MSHNTLPAFRVMLMHGLARSSAEAKLLIATGRVANGIKSVISPFDPVRRDADLVLRSQIEVEK